MSVRSLNRLRLVALLEGVSFLVLILVAMPLKYAAGMPGAVRIVGLAHGLLFIAFAALVIDAARGARWPLSRVAGAFVAAVVPFGTFVLDRRLRQDVRVAAIDVPGDRADAATRPVPALDTRADGA